LQDEPEQAKSEPEPAAIQDNGGNGRNETKSKPNVKKENVDIFEGMNIL
jgi:hypothetical protein